MSGSDLCDPGVVLASRENAGIRVTLLWAKETDTVAVDVLDESSDDRFELLVEPASARSTRPGIRTPTRRGVASTTRPPSCSRGLNLSLTTPRSPDDRRRR